MKIDIEQSTDEWLQWRLKGIGASESPILLLKDKHPYSTPYRLWQTKKGLVEVDENYAMSRGREAEGPLRDWFNREHNKHMKPECHQCDAIPFLIASLDGIDQDEILEIKWTNEAYHLQAKKGSIPEAYRIQIQHQLLCSGASKAYYLSHNAKLGDTVVIEDQPDEELQNKIEEECTKFWAKLEEETFTEYCRKDELPAPPEMEDLFYEYSVALTEKEMAEEKVKHIKDKIIRAAPHTNIKGYGWSVRRNEGKLNTSYASIPEINGMDLSKYQKRGKPSWVIKKENG